MALGGRPSDVVLLYLRRGARLVAAGGLVGLVAALALAPRAASLLYEVQPRDPIIALGAAALLAFVGLTAAYLPARRAARVEPVVALRQE
jgi:putative ABC transport system permease protein